MTLKRGDVIQFKGKEKLTFPDTYIVIGSVQLFGRSATGFVKSCHFKESFSIKDVFCTNIKQVELMEEFPKEDMDIWLLKNCMCNETLSNFLRTFEIYGKN